MYVLCAFISFQSSSLDFDRVKDQIATTLAVLDARLMIPGDHFRGTVEYITSLNDNGFDISFGGQENIDRFKRDVHDKFILAICDNIKSRFPDVAVLEAFMIFDPRKVPGDELSEIIDTYGQEELEILTDHYQSVLVDVEDT
ncbi:uncharacterized protein [Ptychodera flava]|uniref:uncharacterized protein n=1 Tax=Ptychodera flava TaxID=63121 RepID=UPI00396A5236